MNVAIIAAAGQGTRMGGNPAKQFLELAGTPIIIHTLRSFELCEAIQEIILVLPAQDTAGFLAIAEKHRLRKLSKIVPGGTTRAESVLKGLLAVRSATAEIIAVHDGVRPFVTADEITQTVTAAEVNEAAILVAVVTDTIKEVINGIVARTLPRTALRRALTPQCFRFELLRRAYEQVDVLDPELTDESSLVERLGVKVTIVEGSSRNIKITGPEDLALGEVLLREMNFEL
ncbi:MAG TPA: 2-C-methyl-D-erythritol 4-phosphate cytidylyltransferase [Pyrinomonadaceae bacterium]|nr:2-C-methyl-D-erythritol 4-phosphate cytidylyltransferase [Pyrinomonadaceae bacterium]